MLGNPVFIAAVLAILAYGNYLLVKWLDRKYPTSRPITFTSDYKAVLTSPDTIAIGTQSIPVSRKYKDAVKAVLG